MEGEAMSTTTREEEEGYEGGLRAAARVGDGVN